MVGQNRTNIKGILRFSFSSLIPYLKLVRRNVNPIHEPYLCEHRSYP